ncbi:hypothetical protein GQR58_019995 [Nymphon striatum]|nr:hypothetical protein GQR58_019995 [Nymphon striatum]
MNIQTLNPLDHGYELQDDLLVPTVVSEPTIPDDFPHPCIINIYISGYNANVPHHRDLQLYYSLNSEIAVSIRRGKLECLALEGRLEGKRSRSRQRTKFLDIMENSFEASGVTITVPEMLHCAYDRDAWKGMVGQVYHFTGIFHYVLVRIVKWAGVREKMLRPSDRMLNGGSVQWRVTTSRLLVRIPGREPSFSILEANSVMDVELDRPSSNSGLNFFVFLGGEYIKGILHSLGVKKKNSQSILVSCHSPIIYNCIQWTSSLILHQRMKGTSIYGVSQVKPIYFIIGFCVIKVYHFTKSTNPTLVGILKWDGLREKNTPSLRYVNRGSV